KSKIGQDEYGRQRLENSTLKSVNLSHNDFGQTDTTVLADAISENETIEHLDLSWNHFRRKSAKSLLDGIATNSRLRSVNLAMNGLDNEATFGIADILRQSGSVTHVDVSNNRIGVTGAAIIGKALEGNDLLKSLKVPKSLKL
ncbi:LR74A-like protein, partial [Mya arenaria]